MCVIYDLSYLEMTLDVDELDILDIQVGQKAEITADAISDRTFEGVGTSISSAGTTSGGTTTYPVTIRIDDTGSLMPLPPLTFPLAGVMLLSRRQPVSPSFASY